MVAAMFVGLAALSGCGGGVPAAVVQPPPEVTVSKPEVREVTDYFEFPGQAMAIEEVDIRARVTGYLMKVNFTDGQNVKKGDLLYEIDPRPYQALLDRAAGDLARNRALMDKAKANLARSQRLRPSGAVSEDEYEQHVANLAVIRGTIQSAEAALARCATQPGVHQDRLAYRWPRQPNADYRGQPGASRRRRLRRAHDRRVDQSDLRLLRHRRTDAAPLRATGRQGGAGAYLRAM